MTSIGERHRVSPRQWRALRMASDRVCQSRPRRRKLWRSFTKAMTERKRKREVELPLRSPSRVSTSPRTSWSLTRSQWHGNSDAVQGQHATTKKRSQVVGRMRYELVLFMYNSSLSPLPSYRSRLSPAILLFFWSSRRRHMSPSWRRWRKSITWESRSIKHAKWLSSIGQFSGVLLLWKRRIYRFFISLPVYPAKEFFESQRN